MKPWSKWYLKDEVPQWDTCLEPTELRWIGCLTESIWTHKSKTNMLTTQNQLADLLPSGSFTRDEWNLLSRFVQNYELFDSLAVFSVQFTNLKTCWRGRCREKNLEKRNAWWQNRNQWWVQCQRPPISLQQYWVRVHLTALTHSEHTVQIQTALVGGDPLREDWTKTQHRVVKCGIRMKTRPQVRRDPWRKRHIKPLVPSYLTTTLRYPGTTLAILRKSVQMYDGNWVVLKEMIRLTLTSTRWSGESSRQRPWKRQYTFDKITKSICVQPRIRTSKMSHWCSIFRQKWTWIKRRRYLEYPRWTEYSSVDENDFAAWQGDQGVECKSTRLLWFCTLLWQKSWTSSFDRNLEKNIWITGETSRIERNRRGTSRVRVTHNTGFASWDPTGDDKEQDSTWSVQRSNHLHVDVQRHWLDWGLCKQIPEKYMGHSSDQEQKKSGMERTPTSQMVCGTALQTQ